MTTSALKIEERSDQHYSADNIFGPLKAGIFSNIHTNRTFYFVKLVFSTMM